MIDYLSSQKNLKYLVSRNNLHNALAVDISFA